MRKNNSKVRHEVPGHGRASLAPASDFAFASKAEGGTILTVRAAPRASKSAIAGLHGDAIRIQLAAPPVDGEANAELVRLLSKLLGVSKSSVRIISGTQGKDKKVFCLGVAPSEAVEKLACFKDN